MNANISASELRRAATIKDKIEALQSDLTRILDDHLVGNGRSAPEFTSKRSRKMSAAAKAKIAAAQRARWAKWKAKKK
jgi:hypothetical protein